MVMENAPLVASAAPNLMPVKARALSPVSSGPRFWLEAEGGIYGFSKNSPVIAATAPPASTGPTFVPTSPGFIGLTSISTVTNPLASAAPADIGGGGSYRMGLLAGPGADDGCRRQRLLRAGQLQV